MAILAADSFYFHLLPADSIVRPRQRNTGAECHHPPTLTTTTDNSLASGSVGIRTINGAAVDNFTGQ